MNKVKTCQAVCRSLKQEKFEKKQNKMSCIDVTSSFTNLKKSSFNDLIKLVQGFEMIRLTNTSFSWSIQHNLVFLTESISILNLLFTFNLLIFGTRSHSVVLLRQAGN